MLILGSRIRSSTPRSWSYPGGSWSGCCWSLIHCLPPFTPLSARKSGVRLSPEWSPEERSRYQEPRNSPAPGRGRTSTRRQGSDSSIPFLGNDTKHKCTHVSNIKHRRRGRAAGQVVCGLCSLAHYEVQILDCVCVFRYIIVYQQLLAGLTVLPQFTHTECSWLHRKAAAGHQYCPTLVLVWSLVCPCSASVRVPSIAQPLSWSGH